MVRLYNIPPVVSDHSNKRYRLILNAVSFAVSVMQYFGEMDLGNRIVKRHLCESLSVYIRTRVSRGSNRVSVDLRRIWNTSGNVYRVIE